MKPTKQEILGKFEFDGRLLSRRDNVSPGKPNADGYVYQRIGGRPYGVHRLVYFLHTGEWPSQVDHKNGDRSDNRMGNLRAATHAQNCMNRKVSARSGRKGCYWNERHQKWMVQVSVNGKRKTVGYYSDLEEASRAFAAEAKKNYGEFARVV